MKSPTAIEHCCRSLCDISRTLRTRTRSVPCSESPADDGWLRLSVANVSKSIGHPLQTGQPSKPDGALILLKPYAFVLISVWGALFSWKQRRLAPKRGEGTK